MSLFSHYIFIEEVAYNCCCCCWQFIILNVKQLKFLAYAARRTKCTHAHIQKLLLQRCFFLAARGSRSPRLVGDASRSCATAFARVAFDAPSKTGLYLSRYLASNAQQFAKNKTPNSAHWLCCGDTWYSSSYRDPTQTKNFWPDSFSHTQTTERELLK